MNFFEKTKNDLFLFIKESPRVARLLLVMAGGLAMVLLVAVIMLYFDRLYFVSRTPLDYLFTVFIAFFIGVVITLVLTRFRLLQMRLSSNKVRFLRELEKISKEWSYYYELKQSFDNTKFLGGMFFDLQGKIMFMNQTSIGEASVQNVPQDTYAAEELVLYLKALKLEKFDQLVDELYSSGQELMFEIERRVGNVMRWESVMVSPIYNDDEILSAISVFKIDITKYKKNELELQSLQYYHPVTGLPNSHSFYDYLDLLDTDFENRVDNLIICFVDIEDMDYYADLIGFGRKNDVVRAIAARLGTIKFGDKVQLYSYNIDQFCLVMTNGREYRNKFFESVNDIFKKSFVLLGKELKVDALIGAAVFPPYGTSSRDVCSRALHALKSNKEARAKNTVRIYDDELQRELEDFFQISNYLFESVEKDELMLMFQPKIDLRTERVMGCEVLVRWRNATLGVVPPDKFIGIAEKTGYIHELGMWVFENALIQMKKWEYEGFNDIEIAINVSPIQLGEETFLYDLRRILDKLEIENTKKISIELTESEHISSMESIEVIKGVTAMGMKISLDDFGIGYSSLSYLSRLSCDSIKIDRSFLFDIETNDMNRALLRSVIIMGKNLGFTIIVEGAETKEHIEILRELDVEIVQGYYYSKPISGNDFMKMLVKQSE